jgi:muramoyltetrapeptide carboxypeptidase
VRIKLKSKDKIEVIIPGYAVRKDIVRDVLLQLKKLGYQPLLPANANRGHSFHAQTDQVRFALLKKALLSKNDIVWSLRGGYGSNRLMPALAKLKKPKQKKLFIGISDVTSIHAFLNQVWKWPSLHGSLLDRIGQRSLPAKTEKELWNILLGRQDFVEFKKAKSAQPSCSKK